MDRLDIDPMTVMQAAILHDVIEDTTKTTNDLRARGFCDAVLAMAALLTEPAGRRPYEEVIDRIAASGNLGALLIKMSDTVDDLSPERTLPDGELRRTRYVTAFARLHEAASAMGYTGA